MIKELKNTPNIFNVAAEHDEKKLCEHNNKQINDNPELPLGQLLIKAGFKSITPDELHESLCGKLNQKIIDDFKTRHSNKKNIFVNNEEMDDVGFTFYREKNISFIGMLFSDKLEYLGYATRYVVRKERLELYTGDVIPDHCLEKIKKAKKIGINKFDVCYPINGEDLIAEDPIIVGYLGRKMIYICEWA